MTENLKIIFAKPAKKKKKTKLKLSRNPAIKKVQTTFFVSRGAETTSPHPPHTGMCNF